MTLTRGQQWWNNLTPEQKEVFRAKKRNWKKANHGRSRGSQSRHDDKVKYDLLQGYGPVCVWCGCDDERVLTLDHVNDDGYLLRGKNGGKSECRRAIKEGFPSWGQILCENCNRLKSKLKHREAREDHEDKRSEGWLRREFPIYVPGTLAAEKQRQSEEVQRRKLSAKKGSTESRSHG